MDKRIIEDITKFIFLSDEPQKVDIIFIPGGSYPEVPEKAATLYKEGYASLLLPSGGVSVKTGKFNGVKARNELYDKDYRTECEFYTDVLQKNGVPETSILGEDKSGQTKENAFFSHRVVEENNLVIEKAIICCKSYHARRCLMLYQLAFPDTKLYIVPVDCDHSTRNHWFTHEAGIDQVLGELARCGNQFIPEMKEYLI